MEGTTVHIYIEQCIKDAGQACVPTDFPSCAPGSHDYDIVQWNLSTTDPCTKLSVSQIDLGPQGVVTVATGSCILQDHPNGPFPQIWNLEPAKLVLTGSSL